MGAGEKHYSVKQLAELWSVHPKTIIRLFQNEPDVIRLGKPESRFKRKRIILRVPESVRRRVYARYVRDR